MIYTFQRICAVTIIVAILALLYIRYNYLAYFEPVHHGAPRILVVWYRSVGEQETINRMRIAAERLGVEVRAVSTRPPFYVRWVVSDPVKTARDIFQPDFYLTIQDWLERIDDLPNYMTLTLGTDRYIKDNELINPLHKKFDALLPSFQHIDQLKTAYEKSGRNYQGFFWYPTSHATDYPAASPEKLFYAGGFLWDETRGSNKYRDLFTKLDKTGYFAVCGPKRKWKHTPNSAVGFIPVDGKALLAVQHKYGVSLVLHHKLHIDGGAPTGRIFEAVAANTIVISDDHPFIRENFGDNVLYIDIDQDAEGMFNQIDTHMHWIQQNPSEAQRMANNCHNIFLQKFTFEKQINRLLDMHQDIVASQQADNYK